MLGDATAAIVDNYVLTATFGPDDLRVHLKLKAHFGPIPRPRRTIRVPPLSAVDPPPPRRADVELCVARAHLLVEIESTEQHTLQKFLAASRQSVLGRRSGLLCEVCSVRVAHLYGAYGGDDKSARRGFIRAAPKRLVTRRRCFLSPISPPGAGAPRPHSTPTVIQLDIYDLAIDITQSAGYPNPRRSSTGLLFAKGVRRW